MPRRALARNQALITVSSRGPKLEGAPEAIRAALERCPNARIISMVQKLDIMSSAGTSPILLAIEYDPDA